MNIAELIYQETRGLPETEASEILDFVEFIKVKRRRVLEGTTAFQLRGNDVEKADMSEFDQFGSVYDGHFDRDACYDRTNLR